MIFIRRIALCFFVFPILGCSSTSYQKMNWKGGYVDEKIDDGVYRLYFAGNSFTSKETIEEYWHRRASELCGGKYDYKYGKVQPMTGIIHQSDPELFGEVTCEK